MRANTNPLVKATSSHSAIFCACMWEIKDTNDVLARQMRHAVRATFHLTISMPGQRATGTIQRNNYQSRELRAVFNG